MTFTSHLVNVLIPFPGLVRQGKEVGKEKTMNQYFHVLLSMATAFPVHSLQLGH